MRDCQIAGRGTYVLILRVLADCTVLVGKLGRRRFQAGYYAYVGSALGGLRQRLSRHLRADKCLHWHIDYLLGQAEIEEIWIHRGDQRLECEWAQLLHRMTDLRPAMPRFGASDCRCPTHLYYAAQRPACDRFRMLQPERHVECLPVSCVPS